MPGVARKPKTLDPYCLPECRKAAKLVTDECRKYSLWFSACDLAETVPDSEFQTMESNLIKYFHVCMGSARECGATRQTWGGSLLCLCFRKWATMLSRIMYVVIEPGKVDVRTNS